MREQGGESGEKRREKKNEKRQLTSAGCERLLTAAYTVENADDDLGDRKPSVVDSVKVEAPIKVEASVKVEASSFNSDLVCDSSNPMYYMPKFMRPYIEGIVDVIGDGHCGFMAIAECVGLTEESHVMVRRALIKELKENRNKYTEEYTSENRYKYIVDGLHPPKNPSSFAPPDKWLTLLDIKHIVASCYNRSVVEMTTLDIEISETFFPLRGVPPVIRKAT
ncbi:OTU-like cysteine protease [Medicago truncatula]|uniref:OTU-like cysteine protease n=1 Tax=Medicago truncatula TaxID=3880 RepID=A0A072V5Q3_MEDTR|nr:OTU-like cysteine protease [Medicago truncatula]